MLSNKDIAIKETIKKDKTMNTFFNNVFLDIEDVEDYHCETCYELAIDEVCHVWTGSKGSLNYGYFNVYCKELSTRVSVKAHRLAYAYYYGFDALPKGVFAGDGTQFVLNHICHNQLCVNPMHLEVITGIENSSSKKRRPRKANDTIIADNLEDFMEQIRNTERE